MALEREEFYAGIASLKELLNQRCNSIDDDLAKINGRVGRVEDRVNDSEGDIKVLQDRGNRDTTARAQGLGGIATSAAALLWQWLGK